MPYTAPNKGDEVSITLTGIVDSAWTNDISGTDHRITLADGSLVMWNPKARNAATVLVTVTTPAVPVYIPQLGDVALWKIKMTERMSRKITVFFVDQGDGKPVWCNEFGRVIRVSPSNSDCFQLVLRDGRLVLPEQRSH